MTTRHMRIIRICIVALTAVLTSLCFETVSRADVTPIIGVTCQGHVQRIGWQDWYRDDGMVGTTGRSLRMEALRIKLTGAPEGVRIKYRGYVQSSGWQEWVYDGESAGTTGLAKQLEAVQIVLENAPAGFHVEYQAHVQSSGWQEWVRDGGIAGTYGLFKRIEAIKIRIVYEPEGGKKEFEPHEIAQASGPAVVYLGIYDDDGAETADGSGFIVSRDGKIVTNYHVIDNGSNVVVHLEDGRVFEAAYVLGYDKERDIAVLKVNAQNLPVVELGDSDEILAGERVVAIGSPYGLSNTISEGLISNKNRFINGQNYIQTSAAVSPGSSGGALFNRYGEVIGVVTMGVADSQNLNFATPINEVKPFLTNTEKTSLHELTPDSDANADEISKEPERIFEIEPNNLLKEANRIDDKYSGQSYFIYGTITKSYHDLDYYRLDVEKSGTLALMGIWIPDEFRGFEEDLLIVLYNETGEILETAHLQGYGIESFNSLETRLEPGTYYISVFQNWDYKYLYVNSMYGISLKYK